MAEFNNYRVYYYSTPRYSWDVRIDLYMDATPVGSAFFIKAGNPVPANASVGGIPQLYYSITHCPAIMSMLREEKPLYVSLNTLNGIGALSTSSEPVGDQEGV